MRKRIRDNKTHDYVFYPPEGSSLPIRKFKYKSKLIKFLTSNIDDAVNGKVRMYIDYIDGLGIYRSWVVWYNENEYNSGSNLSADLRQLYFRGKKTIKRKTDKKSKRYFAFSDKVSNLMFEINKNGADSNKAKNLLRLFEKRGFIDFTPDEDQWLYINNWIDSGIDFSYWSDRCNWLRTKTIVEYFKKEDLIK